LLKRLLPPSCPSAHFHGPSPLPLDGFSWNFIFECFSKICREYSSFITTRRQSPVLCMNPNIHIWSYVTQFNFRIRNYSDKCCRRNQNTYSCLFFFFSKIVLVIWKNIVETGRPQMTIWRMRIPFCIFKATDTHLEYTGRFVMFPVVTNIYKKKIKWPTLMELFTATGKLKKYFFLTTRDVRFVHHGWHGTHRYDIQVVATHASTCWRMCLLYLRRMVWWKVSDECGRIWWGGVIDRLRCYRDMFLKWLKKPWNTPQCSVCYRLISNLDVLIWSQKHCSLI